MLICYNYIGIANARKVQSQYAIGIPLGQLRSSGILSSINFGLTTSEPEGGAFGITRAHNAVRYEHVANALDSSEFRGVFSAKHMFLFMPSFDMLGVTVIFAAQLFYENIE